MVLFSFLLILLPEWTMSSPEDPAIPAKTVVLTFDDAVKSHRSFVGPLLREMEFGATFFVTQCWMSDTRQFMSWQEIAELHEMGFEIGNHTWSHPGINSPLQAARLGEELRRVEDALAAVGVPKPVSFAWPANAFMPEAVRVLREQGYVFGRRGTAPEAAFEAGERGPLFDAAKHEPLLIPSTGIATPAWTLEHFVRVVEQAEPGRSVVLQFHGVPDVAHPWVDTPAERFEEYMRYLKEQQYRVIALRDLLRYVNLQPRPEDPRLQSAFPLMGARHAPE